MLIFSGVVIAVYLVRLFASDRGKSKAVGRLASSISQWGFSYHADADGDDDAASVIVVMMMAL